jgi:hypothetical protein
MYKCLMRYTLSDKILIMESLLWNYQEFILKNKKDSI